LFTRICSEQGARRTATRTLPFGPANSGLDRSRATNVMELLDSHLPKNQGVMARVFPWKSTDIDVLHAF
jgi:hypothetical protein